MDIICPAGNLQNRNRIECIEISLFLEALYQRHGYDFRHYAKASIKRRVQTLAEAKGCATIAELIPYILHDKTFLIDTLSHLSVPVTEMFRDPLVFKALREQVLPHLSTYHRLQIWQAGCSTGEEVYSLAILLEEADLLRKTTIYATDINDKALHKAEEGVFPIASLKGYESNYVAADGKGKLSDYYTANADFFRMKQYLCKHIVFAHHNLVSDGVFCEVQLILCRNVLIYFDTNLQKRVLNLFHSSLARQGFLCLGTRESLRSVESANLFNVLDHTNMIFRNNCKITDELA
ncbi:chemotaxis protein CheR [Achromatium sp. WMS1]|nr:chemotaxis protein CheR [Achromatium sp. WMS1]